MRNSADDVMKILSFQGTYSYNKKQTYKGLVALCHFEPFDDINLVTSVSLALQKKAGQKQIILVPFVHLYDKVAPPKEAKKLFDALLNKTKLLHINVEAAPFGVEKELNISVAKQDSLISFLNFKPTYLNEVRRLYEVYAEDYDMHMIKTGHYQAQERIYFEVKKYIKSPVLDLACGPGFLLNKIANDFSKVYANDISGAMIDIAKERTVKAKISFTKSDAVTLDSYKNIKLGTIICSNLFYYIKDREKAIRRWKKLLTNAGSIIFIEEYPFINTKSEFFEGKKTGVTSIVSPIPPEEIIALMTHHGFKLKLNTKTAIDKRHDLFGLVFSK